MPASCTPCLGTQHDPVWHNIFSRKRRGDSQQAPRLHSLPQREKEPKTQQQAPHLHSLPQREEKPKAGKQAPSLHSLPQREKEPKTQQQAPHVHSLPQREEKPKAGKQAPRLHSVPQREEEPKGQSVLPHRPSPSQDSPSQQQLPLFRRRNPRANPSTESLMRSWLDPHTQQKSQSQGSSLSLCPQTCGGSSPPRATSPSWPGCSASGTPEPVTPLWTGVRPGSWDPCAGMWSMPRAPGEPRNLSASGGDCW
ncbi:translation initiation factor IF-2-like [Vidua chalybeata]|uniref:translation initiation factor IF-2-like n=1 Tax=Vidua chalybeata TaxID=81927 RepID=UPI0023A7E3A7|nr:translation initiation factor IF-2-like [Vidua chalybeata]